MGEDTKVKAAVLRQSAENAVVLCSERISEKHDPRGSKHGAVPS